MRGSALWAFFLALAAFGAAGIGAFQYFTTGVVQLTGGRPPLAGREALEALGILLGVGALFLAMGMYFRRRAQRKPRRTGP